jgi:tetratricopeptide (TPR) repeat protein
MKQKSIFILIFVLLSANSIGLNIQNGFAQPSTSVSVLIAEGQRLYEAGNYDAALKQFQEAVAVDAMNSTTHYWLGLTHMKQGKIQEAKTEFQKALLCNPTDEKVRQQFEELENLEIRKEKAATSYQRGEAFLKANDLDGAIAAFKEATELAPHETTYQAKYAEALKKATSLSLTQAKEYLEANRFHEALEAFQAALRFSPENAEAKAGLQKVTAILAEEEYKAGESAMAEHKWHSAIVHYERAHALIPDYKDTPSKISIAKQEFSKMVEHEASKHYNDALQYEEKQLWGNAFVEYQYISSFSPKYKDVTARAAKAKQRVQELVAVRLTVQNKVTGAKSPHLKDNIIAFLSLLNVPIASLSEASSPAGFTFIVINDFNFDTKTDKTSTQRVMPYTVMEQRQRQVPKYVTEYVPRLETVIDLSGRPRLVWVKKPVEELRGFTTETENVLVREAYPYVEDLYQKNANLTVNSQIIIANDGTTLEAKVSFYTTSASDIYIEGVQRTQRDGLGDLQLPDDPLELPSDEELLDNLIKQSLPDLNSFLLPKLLKIITTVPQERYFQDATKLQASKNNEQAIENYVKAYLFAPETRLGWKALQMIEQMKDIALVP